MNNNTGFFRRVWNAIVEMFRDYNEIAADPQYNYYLYRDCAFV